MEDIGPLLLAVMRLAVVPVAGYAVLLLARRWPRCILILLLTLIALGAGAIAYCKHDNFVVLQDSRKLEFGSELGRWCFTVGALTEILCCPALPLVAMARAKNGEEIGPVSGGQWFVALFGYFMACAIFSMVLFSWLTGIVK